MINFANLAIGKDDVMILADEDTLSQFEGKVPSNILVKAHFDDIWIRDFSSVIPSKQIKFKYLPDYLRHTDARYTEKTFEDWFVKHAHGYHEK